LYGCATICFAISSCIQAFLSSIHVWNPNEVVDPLRCASHQNVVFSMTSRQILVTSDFFLIILNKLLGMDQ